MTHFAVHTTPTKRFVRRLVKRNETMKGIDFVHFKISGEIEHLEEQEAAELIECEKLGWILEKCSQGKLYLENLDEVFVGSDYGLQAFSLKYNTGISLLRNKVASHLLGFDVFGDCILVSRSTRPRIDLSTGIT